MTDETNIADLCVKDVIAKIVADGFAEPQYVYGQEILEHISSQVDLPVIGVVYEGMFNAGDDSHRVQAEIRLGIYVISDTTDMELKKGADKTTATQFLANVRKALLVTKAAKI